MNFPTWRYRQFHVSYMLGLFAAGIMIGLVASVPLLYAIDVWVVLTAVLVAFGALCRRRWWSVVIIVLCGICIGWARGGDFSNSLSPYKSLIGQNVVVGGTIKDDPQYGTRGEQKFRIHDVKINGMSLPGEVYVGTFSILDVKRGDEVVLKGKLRDGFGSYQASLGFATLQSATAMHDPIREFRDTFAAGTRNAIEEPAASLGLGFVVGQRTALPDELDDQLRIVGLTHIVVASGYNLTILVRFARRLLEKHSKYLATFVSAFMMVAFVAVSGLSPSMTRASLVTGLSLLAWYYGRRFHPLLLIFYVAAVTSYIYPIYIWSDIGWYLSFLAFAGVLIVAPLLVRLIYKNSQPKALVQVIFETTAAQIMTLPIILAVFGTLPVLSIVSNVLVAPFIPLAMLCTTIAGFLGMISVSFAGFVGAAAEIVLGYILTVVAWLATPTWSQVSVSVDASVMVVMYVLIVSVTVFLWRKLRYDFRSTSVVE